MVRDEPRKVYKTVVSDNSRWDGVELRADDIIISTPPKCGTTWMQMLCALLVFQDPRLPGRLTELSPWVDVQTEAVDSVHAALAAQRHRRFMKSHTPLDGLPQDDRVTYICVARDPRDAAISWDHHAANMNLDTLLQARAEAVGLDDLAELFAEGPPAPPPDDPMARFWLWAEGDNALSPSGLTALVHHVGTFWDRADDPNIALFHYADLQADLEGEMRRLAALLAIEVDEATWPKLIAAATFDEMRTRADELAPQVKIDGFWKDKGSFFHRGGNEQWRAMLSDDDVRRYEARVRSLASPDLIDWVHRGWRGAVG